MTVCVIKGCHNASERKTKQYNITYHAIPNNPIIAARWIEKIRLNRRERWWKPSKSTKICSVHFSDNQKYLSLGGLCRIRRGAIPDRLKQPKKEEGPWREDSSSNSSDSDSDILDSNASKTEPKTPRARDQCRVCAEFTKDCIDVTEEHRPYLTRNKTALTLNDLSVELDFNDALPKTVCGTCDKKLQKMFDFVKQVKEVQELLLNDRDDTVHFETIIVKTERDSPKPDHNDDIDSKEDIVNSTVTETVFIKPVIKHKRKPVNTPKTQKKRKVKDAENENVAMIIDIKKETAEINAADETRVSDSETDTKPSELELLNMRNNYKTKTDIEFEIDNGAMK